MLCAEERTCDLRFVCLIMINSTSLIYLASNLALKPHCFVNHYENVGGLGLGWRRHISYSLGFLIRKSGNRFWDGKKSVSLSIAFCTSKLICASHWLSTSFLVILTTLSCKPVRLLQCTQIACNYSSSSIYLPVLSNILTYTSCGTSLLRPSIAYN